MGVAGIWVGLVIMALCALGLIRRKAIMNLMTVLQRRMGFKRMAELGEQDTSAVLLIPGFAVGFVIGAILFFTTVFSF